MNPLSTGGKTRAEDRARRTKDHEREGITGRGVVAGAINTEGETIQRATFRKLLYSNGLIFLHSFVDGMHALQLKLCGMFERGER